MMLVSVWELRSDSKGGTTGPLSAARGEPDPTEKRESQKQQHRNPRQLISMQQSLPGAHKEASSNEKFPTVIPSVETRQKASSPCLPP